jgi:hypothetical protein
MTTALILNIAFSAVVLIALIAHLVRHIATQHRDRGVTIVSRADRYRWERSGPGRPQVARRQQRDEAWSA